MPRAKSRREVPSFSTEDEERAFWSKEDSAEYIDWSRAKRLSLAELKPSTQTISIRLPQSLLEEIKVLANKRDVPYQSLMKLFLAERVEYELRRVRQTSEAESG